MAAHNALGKWGEQIAADYMESKGWYIRHRDWQYNHKDIDIVCIDADMTTLLFIEVKTRSTALWGTPEEAIDLEKKNNLLSVATAYTQMYHMENLNIRFDSISIIGTPDTKYSIEHNKDIISILDNFLFRQQQQCKPRKTNRNSGRWGKKLF